MKRIVPIIMGSEKDRKFAERIGKKLDEFDIPYEYGVASGHKTTGYLLEMVAKYDEEYDLVVYETVAGRPNVSWPGRNGPWHGQRQKACLGLQLTSHSVF